MEAAIRLPRRVALLLAAPREAMVPLLLILLLQLTTPALCYTSLKGYLASNPCPPAPSHGQGAKKPGIGGFEIILAPKEALQSPQPSTPSLKEFVPEQKYSVFLKGSRPFKGFRLYATEGASSDPTKDSVGTLLNTAPSAFVHKNCGSFHALKRAQSPGLSEAFEWTAPKESPSGSITFGAIAVVQKMEWYGGTDKIELRLKKKAGGCVEHCSRVDQKFWGNHTYCDPAGKVMTDKCLEVEAESYEDAKLPNLDAVNVTFAPGSVTDLRKCLEKKVRFTNSTKVHVSTSYQIPGTLPLLTTVNISVTPVENRTRQQELHTFMSTIHTAQWNLSTFCPNVTYIVAHTEDGKSRAYDPRKTDYGGYDYALMQAVWYGTVNRTGPECMVGDCHKKIVKQSASEQLQCLMIRNAVQACYTSSNASSHCLTGYCKFAMGLNKLNSEGTRSVCPEWSCFNRTSPAEVAEPPAETPEGPAEDEALPLPVIVGIVVVLLLVGGGTAYFFYARGKKRVAAKEAEEEAKNKARAEKAKAAQKVEEQVETEAVEETDVEMGETGDDWAREEGEGEGSGGGSRSSWSGSGSRSVSDTGNYDGYGYTG